MLIPHEKQISIIKSRARFKVVRAGRRSGKTTFAVEDMSFDAVSKSNRNIFYVAPTQVQARSIIWEELKKRLYGLAEPNEQRLELRVPTVDGGHSLIKVLGWENRENLRGMKAHKIFFDELDTMKEFFIGWKEIFRPMLTDTVGYATFIGTPKKENPNLRRLEKEAVGKDDWALFHFATADNPHIDRKELEASYASVDNDTKLQEYDALYVDNVGSLFSFNALMDVFSNSVTKNNKKYMIVDVADDGSDKTVMSIWDGLEEVAREEYERMNTEQVIAKIRELQALYRIPMSNTLVDAIGVGAAIESNHQLNGIVGFKSSYAAIKTDSSIVSLPNVHSIAGRVPLVTEFANLRSQCVFKLAMMVNNHKIASKLDGKFKEVIIEELATYQDASKGDGKRMATQKDDVKSLIGRSPDHSDTWIMRMYFEIAEGLQQAGGGQTVEVNQKVREFMAQRVNMYSGSSTM